MTLVNETIIPLVFCTALYLPSPPPTTFSCSSKEETNKSILSLIITLSWNISLQYHYKYSPYKNFLLHKEICAKRRLTQKKHICVAYSEKPPTFCNRILRIHFHSYNRNKRQRLQYDSHLKLIFSIFVNSFYPMEY